jgi:hypothetical protein
MYSYVSCLSRNGRSLLVPQNLRYYYCDSLNINLCCYEKSPRFVEFRVPPVVALAGPDQMILRAGRPPPVLYTDDCIWKSNAE